MSLTPEEIKAIASRAAERVMSPTTPSRLTSVTHEDVVSPRDYWDEHLENNPLRVDTRKTDTGAFLSWMIEAAGDILRESAKKQPDKAYIAEKYNRLKRYLNDRDWRMLLSAGELEDVRKVKELLLKLPAPTYKDARIKFLIEAIVSRDVEEIRRNLEQLKPLLFEEEKVPEEEIKLSEKMVEIPLAPEGKAQEDNKTACPNLQPMAEWIKKSCDPNECRPCALAPVVQWYWDELKEQGLPDLAKRLEQKAETLDEQKPEEAIAICEELDQIKKEVPPALKERLQEFDCAAQLYDPLLQGESVEEASPQSPSA